MAERYQAEHTMAVGGHATVYKALDLRTQTHVALKVLHPHRSSSVRTVQRFHQEIALARELESVHFARVLGGGESAGVHFLAMELLEGADLGRRLRARGALGMKESVELVLDVCKGLDLLHMRGRVHRDIKPENLMLASRGGSGERTVILDLGIAKQPSVRTTEEGAFLGTVGYAAPEQVEAGQTVDARTDVYSLGLVLIECLTGKPVFDGERTQVFFDILLGAPPVSKAPAQLPGALRAAIARATARDPSDRTPNTRALAADLIPFSHSGSPQPWPCANAARSKTAQTTESETALSLDHRGHVRARSRLSRALPWLLMGASTALLGPWRGKPLPAENATANSRQGLVSVGTTPPRAAQPPTDGNVRLPKGVMERRAPRELRPPLADAPPSEETSTKRQYSHPQISASAPLRPGPARVVPPSSDPAPPMLQPLHPGKPPPGIGRRRTSIRRPDRPARVPPAKRPPSGSRLELIQPGRQFDSENPYAADP